MEVRKSHGLKKKTGNGKNSLGPVFFQYNIYMLLSHLFMGLYNALFYSGLYHAVQNVEEHSRYACVHRKRHCYAKYANESHIWFLHSFLTAPVRSPELWDPWDRISV